MNTICISLIILYLVIEKIINILKGKHFLNQVQRAREDFHNSYNSRNCEILEANKKFLWEQLRIKGGDNYIPYFLELEELCNKRLFVIRIEELENEIKKLKTEDKK